MLDIYEVAIECCTDVGTIANLVETPEAVVKRNLWKIVSILCPKRVVSHRTAMEGRPSSGGLVVVTGDYERKIELPGVRIRQMKGPGPLEGDAPFIEGLSMSSRARYLLECSSGKVYGEDSPYLSAEAVEEQLGLRLERNTRGSVEHVVIATAHPPTEN